MTDDHKSRIAGWGQLCEAFLEQEAYAVAIGDFRAAADYAESAEWASLNAFAVAQA